MNTETIKEYAEIMKEYNLASLEIEEDGCRIKLEKKPKMPKGHPPVGMPPMGPPPAVGRPPMPPGMEGAQPAPYEGGASQGAPAAAKAQGEIVNSPMVGVFYAAPAENADPYVKVGDTVKKGDTLCIIEAMKLMNEITAERDGKIAEILVENGAVVEYGTPLFVIE